MFYCLYRLQPTTPSTTATATTAAATATATTAAATATATTAAATATASLETRRRRVPSPRSTNYYLTECVQTRGNGTGCERIGARDASRAQVSFYYYIYFRLLTII